MERQELTSVEKMNNIEQKRSKKAQKQKQAGDRKMWIHLYTDAQKSRSL
jgi:hypothetical protein